MPGCFGPSPGHDTVRVRRQPKTRCWSTCAQNDHVKLRRQILRSHVVSRETQSHVTGFFSSFKSLIDELSKIKFFTYFLPRFWKCCIFVPVCVTRWCHHEAALPAVPTSVQETRSDVTVSPFSVLISSSSWSQNSWTWACRVKSSF